MHRLHRSEAIWNPPIPIEGQEVQEEEISRCREHLSSLTDIRVHPRVLEHVRAAGFYGIHRLVARLQLDRALICALVERWREETHTFHLTVGEATITLQDVAVLTGLRINGPAVTGTTGVNWAREVARLLGILPVPDEHIRKPIEGSVIKLKWLKHHFTNLPADADDETVLRFARAYILMLMGTSMFADKSGNDISLIYLPLLEDLGQASHLSWGSATLAFLYRQLCRGCRSGTAGVAGFLHLLQIWSWEHIHIGRPRIRPHPQDPQQLSRDHVRGEDPLARRWVGCIRGSHDLTREVTYYRDALDVQEPDEV